MPLTESQRVSLSQFTAVSVKNLLLLGFGVSLGFPTILIATLQEDNGEIPATPTQISWIGSINLICVPLGCFLSGLVTQPIGRRRSMQFLTIPFLVAWLLIYSSKDITTLYISLGLTGLAGGLLEAPVLTYVAEVTQPHIRGILAATSTMCVSIGVFIQFLLGTFLQWRTIALVNISFPLSAALCLFFIPESPQWLIQKGQLDNAKKSLAWVRGWTTFEVVQKEYDDLCVYVKDRSTQLIVFKNYVKRNFILPYALVSFAFFVGHFSGMTTLQTYAVFIFDRLNVPIDKYTATMILGVAQLTGTLLCVIFVRFAGKRKLTFISLVGCFVCLVTIAIYARYFNNVGYRTTRSAHVNVTANTPHLEEESDQSQWLPLVILIISALLSHVGIRLLPWLLISEVFPLQVRGVASGLSSGTGYMFAFFANKTFLATVESLTLAGTYGFYAGICFIGLVTLYFVLPETEGQTLLDIESHFKSKGKVSPEDGAVGPTAETS